MFEAFDDSFEELFWFISHYPVVKQVVLIHSYLLIGFGDLGALCLLLLLFFFHLRNDAIKNLLVVIGE